MAESNHTEERSTETDLTNAENGVYRLLDILTEEVSLVTRAANKREWLVRKGTDEMEGREVFETEEGVLTTRKEDELAPETADQSDSTEPESEQVEKQVSLPGAVKAALMQAMDQAMKRLASLVENLKSAEESEEVTEIPAPVLGEFKGLATSLHGLLSRYPSPKSEAKKAEDETPPETEEQTEEVEAVETEKAAWVLPTGVKAKMLSSAETAMADLGKVAEEVKAATEGDETSEPIPGKLAMAIKTVADGLTAMTGMYPSPKSKAEEEQTEESGTEESDVEKLGASPFAAIKLAHTTLGTVMAKIQPGQPIDEESYQQLERLRSLIANLQERKAQPEEQDSTEKSDSEEVEKAGAKMSRLRRKRFQDAIKSLIDLFKEVMPASELGKMPHLQVAKADDQSKEEIEQLRNKLLKTETALQEAKKEIHEIKERPQESAVAQVETTQLEQTPASVVDWPMDLNAS